MTGRFVKNMEQRLLGGAGLNVPVLSFGTGTFGGNTEFFKAWGSSDVTQATRIVDICLESGLNMFDSADVYSGGAAEEILGQAIKGRRDSVLISTKGGFRTGSGPNETGSSRFHLIRTVEASLRRLGTDYIDLYQLHSFDALTPVEEVVSALDTLVKAGKIRYLGCSNFSGWHLMKSLAVSERYGYSRYVAHQAYYSLEQNRVPSDRGVIGSYEVNFFVDEISGRDGGEGADTDENFFLRRHCRDFGFYVVRSRIGQGGTHRSFLS